MKVPEALAAPPSRRYSPVLRVAMFLLLFLLVAWNTWTLATRTTHPRTQYDNLLVAFMLLLNHVAFFCHLPLRLTAPFRIGAMVFAGLVLVHFFL